MSSAGHGCFLPCLCLGNQTSKAGLWLPAWVTLFSPSFHDLEDGRVFQMAPGSVPSTLQPRSGPERSSGIGPAMLIYSALHQLQRRLAGPGDADTARRAERS